MSPIHKFVLASFLMLLAWTLVFQETSQANPAMNSASETALALKEAIETGNETAIRTLLAPDVLIYESGGIERSLEEYANHHMSADMEFMAKMSNEQINRVVRENDDGTMAVITTQSRLTGRMSDKDLDLTVLETLYLSKGKDGWKIGHIHWSSKSNIKD